ncbi:hypothetical protein QN277_020133 [Acacia crassicarpa]|uniref:Reverse transcriptase domain-containing protein n=1 Tax=Acacia crassicarpa TaxID=499986 RepID=A0AAE1MMZ5_9FABA|nr:hypothetical protein QN277_020133 [Acacia crassicarpa]
MWIFHENYNEFLNKTWYNVGDINLSLDNLRHSLEPWNKDVFGLLEQKKQRLLNRLAGIQKATAYPYSAFLLDLEWELQEELERLLKFEEIKWFQKSKSEWITKGDRNTKYYHLKSKMRSRRNMILSLKDAQGNWVDNEEELKVLVSSHFRNLYCSPPPDDVELVSRSRFPVVEDLSMSSLSAVPTDVEIKSALFSMGSYKAPRIDGFPPIFYKANWSLVGPVLCTFVKTAFRGEADLKEANRTLISLIPKNNKVELVIHFRPISLCTVYYKCITKVIASRLREVMDKIISPFQSSFLKGRCIQDNILVGQEILHVMGKNKSKKGLMAIKIDMEKAYDRISWLFLKQVLLEVGFDNNLVNLIINCVSSVSYNVLWNGSLTEFFHPLRGIRQGDPLSPLLFVLCMDKLSHLISDEVESGIWKPIFTSRGGSSVSHLMFADDLLLFGVATETQVLCMMSCVQRFMDVSGGKVNTAKSSVFSLLKSLCGLSCVLRKLPICMCLVRLGGIWGFLYPVIGTPELNSNILLAE